MFDLKVDLDKLLAHPELLDLVASANEGLHQELEWDCEQIRPIRSIQKKSIPDHALKSLIDLHKKDVSLKSIEDLVLLNQWVVNSPDSFLRRGGIGVHNSLTGNDKDFPSCDEVFYLLNILFSTLHSYTGPPELISALFHSYILLIHPFDDGNGRTGRLAEFYLMPARSRKIFNPEIIALHFFNEYLEGIKESKFRGTAFYICKTILQNRIELKKIKMGPYLF